MPTKIRKELAREKTASENFSAGFPAKEYEPIAVGFPKGKNFGQNQRNIFGETEKVLTFAEQSLDADRLFKFIGQGRVTLRAARTSLISIGC